MLWYGGAGRGSHGGSALYFERSEGVHEACVLHIDEEVEMAEEVCTEDGLLDIGKAEYPAVGAAKTKIESERPGTVCRNGSVVDCCKLKLSFGCLRSV